MLCILDRVFGNFVRVKVTYLRLKQREGGYFGWEGLRRGCLVEKCRFWSLREAFREGIGGLLGEKKEELEEFGEIREARRERINGGMLKNLEKETYFLFFVFF